LSPSLAKGGGRICKKGFASLGLSFYISTSKERGKRFIERGETPLLPVLPLPLLREGGQGDGSLNNF